MRFCFIVVFLCGLGFVNSQIYVGDEITQAENVEVVGPAPSPISRIRGMYRWNLFLKSDKVENITALLKKVLGIRKREGGVIITVDVEPY